MDALYVKTESGLQPITLASSGGGGSYVTTRDRRILTAAIPAGTAYEVPEHSVGGADLVICFNGVLCVPDEQYQDISSTAIKFLFDLPIGSEIDAIQFDGGLNVLSKTLS